MKMIPIFRCRSMKEAISFYTSILDFELKEAGASPDDWVVALKNGDAELLLTSLEGVSVDWANKASKSLLK